MVVCPPLRCEGSGRCASAGEASVQGRHLHLALLGLLGGARTVVVVVVVGVWKGKCPVLKLDVCGGEVTTICAA